ncbi:MAG: hypothetical protein JWN76_3372 [Chitinophagaceae bacterium]|nr:hypothetical protein [Chitinophagaceae bacterium]
MKKFLLLLLLTSSSFILKAQTSSADSVKAAVKLLFTGMKNSDPDMIRNSFADSALLQSIARSREGNTIIRNESIEDFAKQIAAIAKGDADERITFDVIKIDGPLAVVWAPYQFYFKGAFSHCGVDSFQLVKINGVWKIQYLIDTRRRDNCQ